MSRARLEALYKKYNLKKCVHPDPLELLYPYGDIRDREIVGLIASSLAYGKVGRILESARFILGHLPPSPAEALLDGKGSLASLRSFLRGFRHRFTDANEIMMLFEGIRGVLREYGSLSGCFLSGFDSKNDETVLPALHRFVENLSLSGRPPSLIPLPGRGSAMKRLNLYLRWMVRKDAVDPGGWVGIPPSRLIIPLDTHMHRLSLEMGLTSRKNPGMRTALEITSAFRRVAPEDPVKYDFVLTRAGIQGKREITGCLRCRRRENKKKLLAPY